MEVTRKKSTFVDDRGEIVDIFTGGVIEYVTLITSVKGAVRGNHYHKETFQYVYMLDGKINLLTQMPEQEVVSTILEKGDLAENPPLERHAMIALENSAFLVLTRGPRGGDNYEKDTYRLPEPLAP